MATNADNVSVGPETPEVSQLSRFVDFRKEMKYWNSRRFWCLAEPFFSHFVNVVFIVKYCNKLLYLCGMYLHPWVLQEASVISMFVHVV